MVEYENLQVVNSYPDEVEASVQISPARFLYTQFNLFNKVLYIFTCVSLRGILKANIAFRLRCTVSTSAASQFYQT